VISARANHDQERFRTTLFGGGARSSAGYKVFFNSRSYVEYVDGRTRVFVSAEGLAPPMTIALYPEEMRVGSITGPSLTDEALRQLIIERVRRAGRYLGWTYE